MREGWPRLEAVRDTWDSLPPCSMDALVLSRNDNERKMPMSEPADRDYGVLTHIRKVEPFGKVIWKVPLKPTVSVEKGAVLILKSCHLVWKEEITLEELERYEKGDKEIGAVSKRPFLPIDSGKRV